MNLTYQMGARDLYDCFKSERYCSRNSVCILFQRVCADCILESADRISAMFRFVRQRKMNFRKVELKHGEPTQQLHQL